MLNAIFSNDACSMQWDDWTHYCLTVVEADLIAALKDKKIAGAAIDVFDQEPLPLTVMSRLARGRAALASEKLKPTTESDDRVLRSMRRSTASWRP